MTLGTARVWLTKPTIMAAWDDWGAIHNPGRLTPFLGVSQPDSGVVIPTSAVGAGVGRPTLGLFWHRRQPAPASLTS